MIKQKVTLGWINIFIVIASLSTLTIAIFTGWDFYKKYYKKPSTPLEQLANNIKKPEELLVWTKENLSYLHPKDGKMENWSNLSPEQVFNLKKGDCIHQATFIKYILSKHGYKGHLLFLNRLKFSDHAVFVWKDNKKIYFLEPIWNEYQGIHGPFKNLEEIGKLIYSWKLKADGKEDKYTLNYYDNVPFGANWFEFLNKVTPIKNQGNIK